MSTCHTATSSVNEMIRAAGQCPLCGGANHCRQCAASGDESPCWCMTANISGALLACVPAEQRDKACVCSNCVVAFHRARAAGDALWSLACDFYLDERGRRVFTAEYLSRRGFCCGSGCRHCPYPRSK